MAESNGSQDQVIQVWSSDKSYEDQDQIAREVAIAIVYNGISHAVMMATPRDLEAFAIGFSLTEQIVKSIDEIQNLEIDEQSLGFEINLQNIKSFFHKSERAPAKPNGKNRLWNMRLESLEQLNFANLQVSSNCELSHLAINSAVAKLRAYQPLQSLTGAVHGAAWCDRQGNIVNLLEDVGRHNALDKLIGTLAGDNKLKKMSWPMDFCSSPVGRAMKWSKRQLSQTSQYW